MTSDPSHLGVNAEECSQETDWRQRFGGACLGKGHEYAGESLSLVRSRKGGWFSAIPAGGKGVALPKDQQS